MQHLNTNANLAKPDDIYDILIHAHDGLSKAQSDALNARLILILFNHIGDEAIIREVIALAQASGVRKPVTI
jgi:hypothetical protein